MINTVSVRSVRQAKQAWSAFATSIQGGSTYLITYYKDPLAVALPAVWVRSYQQLHPELATTTTVVPAGRARRDFSDLALSVYNQEARHLTDPTTPVELVVATHHGHTANPRETLALAPATWLATVTSTTAYDLKTAAAAAAPGTVHTTTTHTEFRAKQARRRNQPAHRAA